MTWTWREFDRRADGVAAFLLDRGAGEQDKVAQYLYNGPHYLESLFASFKAGLAVVNTNYRYTADELDVPVGQRRRRGRRLPRRVRRRSATRSVARLPGIRRGCGSTTAPDRAPTGRRPTRTSSHVGGPGRTIPPWGRSGDHLLLIYTGGTTGMPKGVMWRQDDLFARRSSSRAESASAARGRTATWLAEPIAKPGPLSLPAAPLMHGTGLFNAMATLIDRWLDRHPPGPASSTRSSCSTRSRPERVKSITIVGDAFAKPILRALDAEPERWDISSLRVVISSGVMWSKETKDGLLRHNPRLILVDALGSSEAIGMAPSTTTSDGSAESAHVHALGQHAGRSTDDGRDVVAGHRRARHRGDERSDAARLLQGPGEVGGHVPRSSTACATRSPATSPRSTPTARSACSAAGSQCINTGGEKVYPEEVEEALKLHPTVADAAVVGVPDERFGEAITALVEPAAGRRHRRGRR